MSVRKYFPAYRALWEDRYSEPVLQAIFDRITAYYKSAQFDQEPSYGEMQIFLPNNMPLFTGFDCEACWIGADPAQTATEHGSYSALVLMGQLGRQLKVMAVRRGRWKQDAIFQNLVDFYEYAAVLTGRYPFKVCVERAAAGYGLIDILSGRLPIEPVIPKGSKEDRAAAVAYLVNTGQVAMPEECDWGKDFRYELENFPLCPASDQVDAFVHCLSLIVRPSEFNFEPQITVSQYDCLAEENYESSFAEDERAEFEFERQAPHNPFVRR